MYHTRSFFLLLLFLSSFAIKTFTQNIEPVFEDAEGKTSIITPRGFFGVNTANSSIRFQYFYAKSASPDPQDSTRVGKWNRFYFGADIVGNAPEGIATLFSEGNFNPGGAADLFLGQRSIFFSPIDRTKRASEEPKKYFLFGQNVTASDFLTFRAGIQSARFKLYDPAKPFNQQIRSEVFRGNIFQLAYTVLFNGRTLIGASWDVSKDNNLGALSFTKIKNQTTVNDPASGTTRTVEQEVNAYRGAYATFKVNTYGIDLVRTLISDSRSMFAFNAFGRMLKPEEGTIYRAGLGIYFFPPNKNRTVGGVFVESNDLTNAVSGTKGFLKRVDVGFTIKFTLPSLSAAP